MTELEHVLEENERPAYRGSLSKKVEGIALRTSAQKGVRQLENWSQEDFD